MEFQEFEPRFKSAKTRLKSSAGLNLETFATIGTKWNQPYLSHGLNLNRRSNSLNSATGQEDMLGQNMDRTTRMNKRELNRMTEFI